MSTIGQTPARMGGALPGRRILPRGMVAALMALTLSGCLAMRGGDPMDGANRTGPVTLMVDNQNFKDARIYVIWDNHRQRAGMVVGKTRQSFELDRRFGGDLRVHIDFIAGHSYTTDPLHVWPGEILELVIPPVP